MNKHLVGIVVTLFFANNTVWAEGFRLYGMSAMGQMRGEALVSSTDRPDANWYNPAALVELPNITMGSFGLNYLVVNSEYKSTTGQSAKNNDTNFPLPSAYFAKKINKNVAFGFGVNTPFGLSTRYNSDSPFSYITTGGEIKLLNISPNFAFRISDTLSFGVGVNYYRSTVELSQIIPFSLLGGTDSPLKIDGEGDGIGANTGFLIKISERQRLGITYKSEVTIDYQGGKAKIENVPLSGPYETGAKTKIHFPGMVNIGYGFKPVANFQVEIGEQWTNWKTFRNVDILFDEQTVLQNSTSQFEWKDTWTSRVGGTYKFNEFWCLSGGYFYATTPTRMSTYSPLIPDGNHHVISLGSEYEKGNFTLSVPVVFVFQTGSSNINNSISAPLNVQNVNGNYDLFAYQFGLSVGWKF
jgi:long-chain fatty acid transport protein